jgi:hypothetical protein
MRLGEYSFLANVEKRELIAVDEHFLQRRQRDRLDHPSHPSFDPDAS